MKAPIPKTKLLLRHIERLDRQIERIYALSKRFSWYRLVIIFAGIVAAFLAYNWLNDLWFWVVSLVSVLLFVIIVYKHRQVDRSLKIFKLWTQIKKDHLARLSLDWDHIPEHNPLIQNNALSIDLDLFGTYSLHRLIDTASSQEGSNRLANWLTSSSPRLEDIHFRQGIIREIEPLVGYRDKLQLEFLLLTSEKISGNQFQKWLLASAHTSNIGNLLVVASLLTVLNISLISFTLMLGYPDYWFVSFFVYLIFYLLNQKKLSPVFDATVEMDRELDVFKSLLKFLEKYPYSGKPALMQLCKPFFQVQVLPSKQLQMIKFSTAAVGLRMNPIMTFLLNILVPWDFICAYIIDRQRKNIVKSLPVWLDAWYELEALISLANYKYLNPSYSFPNLFKQMTLDKPVLK